MELVGEYRGKPTPDVFAELLNNAGNEYGKCMIVVENNSVGFAVLEKLRDKVYPNIYYSYKSSHEYVDPLTAEHSNNAVAGFTTSSKTRPLVVAKMEEFIRNKLITIYSNRLYNEMSTFIWHNGKPQAMRKYNDDLIMSCAIGCWVKDIVYETNQRDIEYQKAFLNSMSKSTNQINTTIPGMIGYNKKLREKQKQHKNQMEQFGWILKG